MNLCLPVKNIFCTMKKKVFFYSEYFFLIIKKIGIVLLRKCDILIITISLLIITKF